MVGGIQVSGALRVRAVLPFLPIDRRTRDFQDYAGLRQKPESAGFNPVNLVDSV
jgi:hypothetical protein